ncbi:hypothetical protein BAZ12_15055 [Elizabethkingia miricola]|uniref:Addiction module protein n=1 Tax=Elizabethkingia miricola TaxID=172045 RepID=A0ABD4DKL2_ELIMR|nr:MULTISPECIES: hypothetical protein [Elizabethkingia]KUG11006.1 hypothetical protein AMC91_15105 [Elizabethkingia miricola]KUY17691.1 hypothetical protein ATB95_15265 [Elizabethkingia miricola]MCL1652484.1 hypothetical protein [Elizabethkingia miricola]MCL1656508.1 hypothetical protein [Elizabethkingia miricola]MCL1680356.1 hypothetical protein [Elizabethkingia miricola]
MNSHILNKKLELIQWLSTLEDQSIIEKLIALRKEEAKDWWNSISDDEKNAIEKGIEDADSEKLETHSNARKLYEKWL